MTILLITIIILCCIILLIAQSVISTMWCIVCHEESSEVRKRLDIRMWNTYDCCALSGRCFLWDKVRGWCRSGN